MINLSVFFFLLFTSAMQPSTYKCAVSGITYFPEQKEISLHPMFIIEGYAFSQEHIKNFKNREVYLESASGQKIVLELQEILKGQMHLTQAVFKPAQSLSPHSRYYLKLSKARSDEELQNFKRYNSEENEWESVYWDTTNMKYSAVLDNSLKIDFKETTVEFYGCGPAANAVFDIFGKGKDEIWYKTEMMNLSTDEKTIYYLREREGRLYVGHDMCSGEFTYNKEGEYKVRFTPLNIDGKELETTSWIGFDSPFLQAKNP